MCIRIWTNENIHKRLKRLLNHWQLKIVQRWSLAASRQNYSKVCALLVKLLGQDARFRRFFYFLSFSLLHPSKSIFSSICVPQKSPSPVILAVFFFDTPAAQNRPFLVFLCVGVVMFSLWAQLVSPGHRTHTVSKVQPFICFHPILARWNKINHTYNFSLKI